MHFTVITRREIVRTICSLIVFVDVQVHVLDVYVEDALSIDWCLVICVCTVNIGQSNRLECGRSSITFCIV